MLKIRLSLSEKGRLRRGRPARDGGDGMPDYKGMYLAMLRASESAIETLIGAQRACEEQYLSADETPVELLPKQPDDR